MSTSHFKDDFWSTVRLEKMSTISKEMLGEAFILPVSMFSRRLLLARETAVSDISQPKVWTGNFTESRECRRSGMQPVPEHKSTILRGPEVSSFNGLRLAPGAELATWRSISS